MKLQIHYLGHDDEITERIITNIELDPPYKLHAFCHLRNEVRSFALSRIKSVIDLESGEIITDLYTFLGLGRLKPVKPTLPIFPEKPTPLLTFDAQKQRKDDKRKLFQHFVLPIIKEEARKRLYALFGNKCFMCASQNRLEIDHHIPQYLGGRLWAGNLVLLCSACNSRKRDKHPREFYSLKQLENINRILINQLEIFNFKFDWEKWGKDNQKYLLQLGIDPILVNEVLTNPDHSLYVGSTEA